MLQLHHQLVMGHRLAKSTGCFEKDTPCIYFWVYAPNLLFPRGVLQTHFTYGFAKSSPFSLAVASLPLKSSALIALIISLYISPERFPRISITSVSPFAAISQQQEEKKTFYNRCRTRICLLHSSSSPWPSKHLDIQLRIIEFHSR